MIVSDTLEEHVIECPIGRLIEWLIGWAAALGYERRACEPADPEEIERLERSGFVPEEGRDFYQPRAIQRLPGSYRAFLALHDGLTIRSERRDDLEILCRSCAGAEARRWWVDEDGSCFHVAILGVGQLTEARAYTASCELDEPLDGRHASMIVTMLPFTMEARSGRWEDRLWGFDLGAVKGEGGELPVIWVAHDEETLFIRDPGSGALVHPEDAAAQRRPASFGEWLALLAAFKLCFNPADLIEARRRIDPDAERADEGELAAMRSRWDERLEELRRLLGDRCPQLPSVASPEPRGEERPPAAASTASELEHRFPPGARVRVKSGPKAGMSGTVAATLHPASLRVTFKVWGESMEETVLAATVERID